MFKKLSNKAKSVYSKVALAMVISLAAAVPAFAEEVQPTLSIDFQVADMFVWAQTIINAMLPIVYITMGLGLGFLIIRSLRSAFM